MAWVVGVVLTAFYIILYFYPEHLEGLIRLFDPLSEGLSGKKASQWFVYGVLYTLAIVLFGIKFIIKYKHSKYQKYRTYSVIFFQTIFAFLIPEIMARIEWRPALLRFEKYLAFELLFTCSTATYLDGFLQKWQPRNYTFDLRYS